MENAEKNYQEELVALKKEFEEFIYIVSHDIKAPMRAISNITSWIEQDLENAANDDVLTNLSLLKNRVSRLENMMNALLELSRVDRTDLEFYEINILKMIRNCIDLFDQKSNMDIQFKVDVKSVDFVTLGVKMQKVILSVLDNAVRFCQAKNTEVFISVVENDTDYEIKIIDNGPGIPEQAIPKIFSIFYTVNSKDILNTTGAGLAISYKIMKLVGGKIQYSPGEDSGSVFTINWPKIITLKN